MMSTTNQTATRCPSCHYDLHDRADAIDAASATCPECGETIDAVRLRGHGERVERALSRQRLLSLMLLSAGMGVLTIACIIAADKFDTDSGSVAIIAKLVILVAAIVMLGAIAFMSYTATQRLRSHRDVPLLPTVLTIFIGLAIIGVVTTAITMVIAIGILMVVD